MKWKFIMTQKDDRVYVRHMIDNSNKAINFVRDISREDFDRGYFILMICHQEINFLA
jgi:uncharacterized protein with HEPN domain